jgi:hypothetical protein
VSVRTFVILFYYGFGTVINYVPVLVPVPQHWNKQIIFLYRCLFRPEFWVSVSDVPGRSFLLFEWFEPRHTETEKEFAARQKIEQADHVQFFYLEEKLKNELSFVVFLKFISLKTPLLIFPDPGNMVRDVHPGLYPGSGS